MADLEGQISTLESEREALQSDLAAVREELETSREEFRESCETVHRTQDLYQHELMQHGKTMELLIEAREKVSDCGAMWMDR